MEEFGNPDGFVNINDMNLGDVDFLSWYSVDCSKRMRIKYLYLRGNGIVSLWDTCLTPNIQATFIFPLQTFLANLTLR